MAYEAGWAMQNYQMLLISFLQIIPCPWCNLSALMDAQQQVHVGLCCGPSSAMTIQSASYMQPGPDDPSPIIRQTAPCWLQAGQSRSSRHDDAIASLMGLPAQQPADSGQIVAAHAEPSSSDQSAISDEAS